MPNSVSSAPLPSMQPAPPSVLGLLAVHPHILLCMHGLPRGGKSTWARKQGLPTVCLDSVRLAIHGQPFIEQAEPFVEATARIMVRSLFFSGSRIVILDATNMTKRARANWYEPGWTTFWKSINMPAHVCMERAIDEGRHDLVRVITRMNEAAEPLDLSCKLWPE